MAPGRPPSQGGRDRIGTSRGGQVTTLGKAAPWWAVGGCRLPQTGGC
jgi:hypothetical protein